MEEHLEVAVHVAGVALVDQPHVILAELLLPPHDQHDEEVGVDLPYLEISDFLPFPGHALPDNF